MQFDGKVAVMTGAAKGIGQATARIFAREEVAVALLDVDETGDPTVTRSLGERALFVRCDVGSAADADAALRAGFITGQPIRIDGGLGLSIGGSERD